MTERVLLIGMMGAGKSSVGRALSALTGWEYVDNDELVERATGAPTPDVFAKHGVEAMRAAEAAALDEALRTPAPVIAGVAAGVIEEPVDAQRLHDEGFTVWLRAELTTLAERVGTGEGRAWLQPDPLAALRKLYVGRPEKYAAAADLVVDVDDIGPDEVARRILDAMRERGSVS
ncbi:MAG: serine transporter [Actinomycetota bacterium]|nr:serine transporter [Actinomycetota bacterium]